MRELYVLATTCLEADRKTTELCEVLQRVRAMAMQAAEAGATPDQIAAALELPAKERARRAAGGAAT